VPNYEQLPPESMPPPRRRLWPIGAKDGALQYGVLKMVSPTLVTPRDFDLSPYFRNRKVQYHREHALRLSQDSMGRRHASGARQSRRSEEGRLTI